MNLCQAAGLTEIFSRLRLQKAAKGNIKSIRQTWFATYQVFTFFESGGLEDHCR